MHMEHAPTEIVILQLQKVQTKFNGNLRGALYRKPRVPSSHWFLSSPQLTQNGAVKFRLVPLLSITRVSYRTLLGGGGGGGREDVMSGTLGSCPRL